MILYNLIWMRVASDLNGLRLFFIIYLVPINCLVAMHESIKGFNAIYENFNTFENILKK